MTNLTHILRWLWDASKGYRLSICAVGLVSTFSVAVSMVNVWVSKRLIDIATRHVEGDLVLFIVIFASCALLQLLEEYLPGRAEKEGDR